jgi:predicted dehydrogenase
MIVTTQDRLGIGIVGCGIISEVQAESIQQTKNARLVSVYSRNPENAERVGQKFDVPWSTDWDAFIEGSGVDIVSVCTPSGNHLDYGKLAAEAGKHVVVEKPIEVTVERGRQLIAACQDHGVKLAVIYQNRFVPDVQRMKQRVNDQAIHTIDLLQWIAGEVESVCGQIGTLTHEGIEGEDNAVATIRFKSGALGVIEGSTSVQPPQPRRLEIHGSKGIALLTGNSPEFIYAAKSQQDSKETLQTKSSIDAQKGYSLKPHQRQFEAIVEAINVDEDPPVSGMESLKSLAIIQGIYESSKRQQPVKLSSL